MKSWKLISLLLPLFLTLSCKEQVGKKNILFLVPYEPTTQVYNSFIHTAEAEFSDSTLYSLHFQYVYEDNIYTYTRKAYEKDLGRQLRAAMRNVKARNFNPDLIMPVRWLRRRATIPYSGKSRYYARRWWLPGGVTGWHQCLTWS